MKLEKERVPFERNDRSTFLSPRQDKEKTAGENKFKPRRKKKVCSFCTDKNFKIDFKETIRLHRFMSDRSKILPRRVTGMCSRHQRVLTLAIKRARFLALLPYYTD